MRFVFVIIVTSMTWSKSISAKSNDRLDELIAATVHMSEKFNDLVKDVEKINENNEKMENLVIHVKESMNKLVTNENDMEKEVAGMKTQMVEIKNDMMTQIDFIKSDMKAQIDSVKSDMKSKTGDIKSDIKNEFATVDEKMKKMNNNVITSSLMSGWKFNDRSVWEDYKIVSNAFLKGWKYYGRGYYSSYTGYTGKYHTTFQQCLDFCEHKRGTDGKQWNGMVWRLKDGWCECYKNDGGHYANPNYIHFKTE